MDALRHLHLGEEVAEVPQRLTELVGVNQARAVLVKLDEDAAGGVDVRDLLACEPLWGRRRLLPLLPLDGLHGGACPGAGLADGVPVLQPRGRRRRLSCDDSDEPLLPEVDIVADVDEVHVQVPGVLFDLLHEADARIFHFLQDGPARRFGLQEVLHQGILEERGHADDHRDDEVVIDPQMVRHRRKVCAHRIGDVVAREDANDAEHHARLRSKEGGKGCHV
mmetsp:Transcript_22968/g.71415  ORF Transcript_22968/g.71415 Transcript_22968/m.71415 type:complete len:222 (+) Transcript_22968:418-1083(+)